MSVCFLEAELKKRFPGFREVEHGGMILDAIDIKHVLSRPDTCASLRSLFAWCVRALEEYQGCDLSSLHDDFRLRDGLMSEITGTQLELIERSVNESPAS